MTMPPPARKARQAPPAASKARAPLCITPQMSTIQASKVGASSAIEARMGMAAGVMRPHLEQIRPERKSVAAPHQTPPTPSLSKGRHAHLVAAGQAHRSVGERRTPC